MALADRLWASHKLQLHEVMAVQEPASGEQVAAVQPRKKQWTKKKTGGDRGASSGDGGVLSHAEQVRVGSGLCFSATEPRPTVALSLAAGRETRAPGAA